MILGPRGEDQMLAMCIYVHRRRNFQHLASERRLCFYVQISSVFHFNKLCKFVLTFCVYFCLFLGIELFYVCLLLLFFFCLVKKEIKLLIRFTIIYSRGIGPYARISNVCRRCWSSNRSAARDYNILLGILHQSFM